MTEMRILSGSERSGDSRRQRCLVCRRRFASSHLLLLHKRRGHCATEALRRRVREDRRPKRLPAASAGRSVLPEPASSKREPAVPKKAAAQEPPRSAAEASPRMACDDCGEQFDGLRHLAHHSTVLCRQESQRRRFGRKVAVEPRRRSFAAANGKTFAAAKGTAVLPPSSAPLLKPTAKVQPSPAGSHPLLREKAASVAGPPQTQSDRGEAGRSEKRDALVGRELAPSKCPLKSRWSKRRDHQISNGLFVAKEPEQILCDKCGGSFGGLQLLVWHVKFRCNAEKGTKSSASARQLGAGKVPSPQKKHIASVLQIKPAKTITPMCRKKISRLYTDSAATRTGRAPLRVTATSPEQFMCDSCGGSFAKLQLLVRHVKFHCSSTERSAKAIETTISMRRKKALPLHSKSLSARKGGTSDNSAQRPRLKLLIDPPRVSQGRKPPQKPASKLEEKPIREKAVLRTTKSSVRAAGKASSMLMKDQVSSAAVASPTSAVATAPSAEERSKSGGTSISAESPAAAENMIQTKRAEEPTTKAKPQSNELLAAVPVAPNAQVAQLSEPTQGPEQHLTSQADHPFEVAAECPIAYPAKMERASDEEGSVAASPPCEVLSESVEPFRAPSPSAIGIESASEPWYAAEPFKLAPEIAEEVQETSAENFEDGGDQGSWRVDQSMPANAPKVEAKMEPFRAPSPAAIGLGGGEEGSEGGSEQRLSPFRLQPEDEDQQEDQEEDWEQEEPHSPSAPADDCLEPKRAFVSLKKLSPSFIVNFMEQKRQNELPSGSFSAPAIEMSFAQPLLAAPESQANEPSSLLASDGIYMTATDGEREQTAGLTQQISDATAAGIADEPYSSEPILAPFSMAGPVAAAGDLTPPQPESFPSSAAAEGPEDEDDDLPDVVPELELLEEGQVDLAGDGELELEEGGPLGDDSILILPGGGGASGQSLAREAAPDKPSLCREPRAPLVVHASTFSSQAPSAGKEASGHDKDGGQVKARNTIRNAPKSKHPLEMEEINDDSEDSLLDLLDD